MNLIIVGNLVEPPSESLSFRYLTLISKHQFKMDNLIEVEQEMKDSYYNYLKNKGLMDFISYILNTSETENGIRLDTDFNYSLTIKTKFIGPENIHFLLGQIRSLSNL